MLSQILLILTWCALPVGLACVVDDWFLRPRRQLQGGAQARDPALMALCYHLLPVLVGAAVLRLLLAERLDFSAVLLLITLATGVVWGLDVLLLRRGRRAAARARGRDAAALAEPGTVDYARSFFPVALVVLVLRAFVFEPFRIPSDSMMPTLLDGDFIIVNKFAYGLRWPVLNRKFLELGSPQRGDVVVFRYPVDPKVNFIKRLVGLPGDLIEVRNDRITINGRPVPFEIVGPYNDGCYLNMQLAREHLGGHEHEAMLCPVPLDVVGEPLPGCNRHINRSYICGDQRGQAAALFAVPQVFSQVVPPGHYLMMGDNRDNSDDGRHWGFVPEENLVGKATRIWFNWDLQRSGGPTWSRIGSRIN